MTKKTEAEEIIGQIKARRVALSITQKALSEDAGLTANYVCRLEANTFDNPSFPKIFAIQKSLDRFEASAAKAAE